jgi:hypothetical protein
MQENFDFVQKGFRILLSSMTKFICKELSTSYGDKWWKEVLNTLSDQKDLRIDGTYDELVNSLDIANCIRLIDRKWNEIFRNVLSIDCRALAKELMGVRNIVAHIKQNDLEQPMAERALDTMALLCEHIDNEAMREIRVLYKEVRARSPYSNSAVELVQPLYNSTKGIKENSLLSMVGTKRVQKTKLSRKVTYGGQTIVYPVYKVRIDELYYNDQNDRIATWISGYESENGTDSLSSLKVEIYNRIIEEFIVESNPEAINKTQKNISLVGQRVPGVTLADGRVVDGNRRYTCLRRIQRNSPEPLYFETVIMDLDIHENKKQIKLLELAIQHGEEEKVDYDPIEYAVGTYRDIVQTGLLSAEEYASSTNESVADVKKRIEIATVIDEFLKYLKLPEQYHIAKDFQVYSLFQEMMVQLKQLEGEDKELLKFITFNNTLMHAIPEQKKFIRDIKGLIKNNCYRWYFDEQKKLNQEIHEKYDKTEIRTKQDVERFASTHLEINEKMQNTMERALQKSRNMQLKLRPSENVEKSINLLQEVDPRLFDKMDEDEKENLKANLDYLVSIVDSFKKRL